MEAGTDGPGMTRQWISCLLALGTLPACMEQSFHRAEDVPPGADTAAAEGEDPGEGLDTAADTGESPSSQGEGEGDPPGDDDEPELPEHQPRQCDTESMVWMSGSSGHCPAHHAAYMMDDGNGPNFICCPLPAEDILLQQPSEIRGTSCAAGEVITGFAGQYSYRCTAIDTERYQLGGPQEPCYFGSGASGGSGVSGCADHPHSWDVLQQSLFGSDGCSGSPYGALFMSHTGKDCEDQRAAQLQYTGLLPGDPAAGTPVEMYLD